MMELYPGSAPINSLYGRPVWPSRWDTVDGPEGAGKTDFVLHRDEILYLFKGRGRVADIVHRARWTRELSFRAGSVYARTREGVFRIREDSMRSFEQRLPERWFRCHESVIVNLDQIKWTRRQWYLAGFLLGNDPQGQPVYEAVSVAKRAAAMLDQLLDQTRREKPEKAPDWGKKGTDEDDDVDNGDDV